MAVQTLDEFLAQAGTLSAAERATLVGQATALIDQVYVHLPLKRALHAVDPVRRLHNLAARSGPLSEREFHDELIAVFTELRDLHTNYILPAPYAGRIAFLPFLVEEACTAQGTPRYLVTKLLLGFAHPSFGPGAEITHWSGVPIDRAVELNAARQAGSNADARHARGLEALTLRDMGQYAPPDDHWVDVRYLPAGGGEAQEIRLTWQVFAPDPAPNGVDPADASAPSARVLGYDASTEARRRAKKALFNEAAMQAEAVAAAADRGAGPAADPATTSTMPDVFSFRAVTTPAGTFGYLRIWTFMVDDADAFLAEAVRILGLLPQHGLVVDVRGNGGGNLLCAEGALQLFTPRRVQPTLLSFLATPLTLALCAGPGAQAADLAGWHDPIALATRIGSPYSQGLPIMPEDGYNTIGQRYQGPVLLITDALCYSATDMFAAGFRDNAVGPILGTMANTGAGGANVWTHELFRELFPGPAFPFRKLPRGATFRVAFRRTTRQGASAGTPIEDLGIVPDAVHRMTGADVLSGNPDLLAAAGAMLAARPVRALAGALGPATPAGQPLTLSTSGLDRVDVDINGRPVLSADVVDGDNAVTLPPPPAIAKVLGLAGYAAGELAVRARLDL
jgi:hypothetical protein